MVENENTTFVTLDENGNRKEYKILLTYSCEELGKDYALITDESRDENGKIKIIPIYFNEKTEEQTGLLELDPVKNPDELELAQEAMKVYLKQMEEGK